MLPKTNVLALAIVAALIAVLLCLWMFVSRPKQQTAERRTDVAQTDDTEVALESGPDLEASSARSRADVNAQRVDESASPAASKPTLRIQVRYASGRDEEPEGLTVGISNRMGELFQPRHNPPNEFVLVEEAPDVYLIAAKAQGFRRTIARAVLSPKSAETVATVTLTPERKVLVRWRADDGRPIVAAITDPKYRDRITSLEVYLTKFSTSDSTRPLDRHALAVWRGDFIIAEGPDDKLTARDALGPAWLIEWPLLGVALDPSAPKLPDEITTMTVEEDGVVWANAYCCGEWVASLPVQPAQREVDFVTRLDDLGAPGGSVSLVVVDAESGQPVAGAGLFLEGDRDAGAGGDARSNAQGVLVRAGIPPGPQRGNAWTEGYRGTNVRFMARTGENADLGMVRLVAEHPVALFNVTGAEGKRLAGASFDLVALEDDADSTVPRRMYTATSEFRRPEMDKAPVANLRFDDVEPGRYLLRCNKRGLDAAPRIVEPHELKLLKHATPMATIAVRAAGIASFVLDPPVVKGTQVLIETAAGHPLRELDVDEYGVAATDILPGEYRVRLVEYGRATDAISVHVDSTPFVFEIHR